MEKVRLTIIVSAFNEEDSIAATLVDLQSHLPSQSEILVVDGGSDRTGEIVRSMEPSFPGLRHIAHTGDRGKGHAIRTGIKEARGEWHVQFDADGQFLAKDIATLVQPLEAGEADVVLGSRFMPSSEADKDAAWHRNLGNFLTSAWASILFAHRLTDVLAGIKAWTREAAAVIDLQSDTFEYEVEIPSRALRRGLRVVDRPVGTRARDAGESKVPVLRTGMKVLTATTRFRLQP
ncbi:glycosyltransferase family 2 protein [Haloferula sp.]|uniref:glycosyltransferase family 2 protein n=1 Tax=Haloferula sp. TaxID=2497595 RepID=UPI00329DBB6E